jgi:hypothetical protein
MLLRNVIISKMTWRFKNEPGNGCTNPSQRPRKWRGMCEGEGVKLSIT